MKSGGKVPRVYSVNAPTVADAGYPLGTEWVHALTANTAELYLCNGNTAGAAVWNLGGVANPLIFRGDILVATDFPTLATVENGWFYTVSAVTVTDNNPTRTNTGQTFVAGDEIVWNATGLTWVLVGSLMNHAVLINRDLANQHPASAITNTPAGTIVAITIQAAINELDAKKLALTGGTLTGDLVGVNINYTEGILSEPVITAVDATHISITTCQVLIRSDAVFGADETLYRKTVAQNTNLLIDGATINYIYVTWSAGSAIYGSTTSRNTINNSNYIPVARVVMEGVAIKYQLSYGALGKGNPAKNFDRVMRIRGTEGIERESGFTLTETAVRVVNVGAGNAWFGLRRIASDVLGAIVQGGVGVSSELWYHELTTGNWVHTPAIDYDNTQYDDAVTPYAGLQTLTNTSRYAVNWIFRNVTEDEIDIVLGTGDYTLSQATASLMPVIPPEIAAFYVLCGRIIVKKSAATATLIQNIANTSFGAMSTNVHSELSNLAYADSGHTGFQPALFNEIIQATSDTLSIAEVSGMQINNFGQAAADNLQTLPTAAEGMSFTLVCGTAQAANYFGVQADTNDKVYLDGVVGADNGIVKIAVPVVGAKIVFSTFQTEGAAWDWMAATVYGNWVAA